MSTVNTNKTKSKRIFYFDALRALAIISVVVFHVFLATNPLVVGNYPNLTHRWLISDIMGTSIRFGVDLFLMLSGALSLGRVWDIKSFLSKRLPRIILPFLFWGFVLGMIYVCLAFTVPGFHYRISSLTLMPILDFLKGIYLAKSHSFGPYWFFWMILGTYLAMPILNKWLCHSDLKEAEYFLAIWLFVCIVEKTLLIESPISLSFFSGPLGMVVLGYYLRYTERKIFNSPCIALAGLILSVVVMVAWSYCLSTPSKTFFFDRYSLFVVVEVASIFILFKNFDRINIKSKILNKLELILRKALFSIAKYSYGIYLIHEFIIIILLKEFLPEMGFGLSVIVYFVGSLGISWAVMAILNRVPYLNRVIGAK